MFKRVLRIVGGDVEQIKVTLPLPEVQFGFTAVICWEMVRKDTNNVAKLNTVKQMLQKGLTNKTVQECLTNKVD